MSEDLIDVCISIGRLTISVSGLLKKLFGSGKRGPADIVAERFLSVFGAHGVAVSQIPRLLPGIGLDKLSDKDALLGALTPDVLDATATLFGVQREWMDGTVEEIYPYRSCYKHPERFFEDLVAIKADFSDFPVFAMYSSKRLNAEDGLAQPMALVLAETVADLGDARVYRYHVYGDTWDWSYRPCRLQLKAMVRLLFLKTGCTVPLHKIAPGILEAVRSSSRVPDVSLQRHPPTNPCLEDFALSLDESSVAQECEELPTVLEYISVKELEAAAGILAHDHRSPNPSRKPPSQG